MRNHAKKESKRTIELILILLIFRYFSSFIVASFIYFFTTTFFYFEKGSYFILQNGVKTELTNIKKEQKKLQDLEKVRSKTPGDHHQIVSFYKPIISKLYVELCYVMMFLRYLAKIKISI